MRLFRFLNIFYIVKKLYYRWQILSLRINGAKIGMKISNFNGFIFHGKAEKLSIGNNTTINYNVFFQCWDKVSIGNNVHLSPFVQLYTARLIENIDERNKHSTSPIVLEDNVWVGANSIIIGGVKIGKNSIVGAHSLVNKDVPPNSVVAGIPAVIIKKVVL